MFQTIRPRQAITVTAQGVYQISGTPGPVGPQGPAGPAGANGAAGPAGASPFSLVGSNAVFLGGAVGIGSNMPMSSLEVQGGDDSTGSTAISQVSLAYAYGGGFRHFIRSRHSGVSGDGNAVELFINNTAGGSDSIAPGMGNNGVFSINAAGQAAIGTTSNNPPATELQLRSQGGNNADFLIRKGNADFGYNIGTDGDKLFFARSDGNTYGDQLIIDGVTGRVGFGNTSPAIRIDVANGSTIGSVSGNTHALSNRGTKVSFGYAPATSLSEFAGMRAVVVPATNNCSATGNSADLRFYTWECNTSVSREVVRFNGTGQTANISGAWSMFSDARLKHDIRPLEGVLDRVLELRGRTFFYNKPGEIGQGPGLRTGFVAQEVENVFPEWISESDGYKTLTISGFEALTVESLRELRAEKDAQIAELRSENAELRERLAALEAVVARLAK